MAVGTSSFEDLKSRWISSGDYSTIFQKLLINPQDPQVVVVAGTISMTGTVSLMPTYFLNNGISTPYSSAESGTVTATDASGNIVAQSSFSPTFVLTTDSGVDIPIDAAPFLVQLPFSQGGTTIQIVNNGKTLASINPNSQLLLDAIKAVPDSSFKSRANENRERLLNAAQRIEHFASQCHPSPSDKDAQAACANKEVIQVLELREKVNRTLNDSIVKTSVLQMTKEDVLGVTDAVVLHLLPNMDVSGHSHPFRIWVLPPGDHDDRSIFQVDSFSQGHFGAVSLNKDGSVTYKPSGSAVADTFTVTILDKEGASHVRTVSVTAAPRNCDSHGEDFDYFGRWPSK